MLLRTEVKVDFRFKLDGFFVFRLKNERIRDWNSEDIYLFFSFNYFVSVFLVFLHFKYFSLNFFVFYIWNKIKKFIKCKKYSHLLLNHVSSIIKSSIVLINVFKKKLWGRSRKADMEKHGAKKCDIDEPNRSMMVDSMEVDFKSVT